MNGKIHYVCLLFKKKDNIKTAHWVGHLQLKSLDNYIYFKRTLVMYDIQAIVTGNTIEQSALGKNNPYLLQE